MSLVRCPGRRRPALVIAAVIAVATVVGGCAGPAPLPPSATASAATDGLLPTRSAPNATSPTTPVRPTAAENLLLLVGRPGTMGLEVVTPDGVRRPFIPPDPDVAWISTDAAGRILATTRAGRAFISQPLVPGGEPVWAELVPRGVDRAALAGPLAFGTVTADGSQAAFLAADFGTNGPFQLVLVGTSHGTATAITIAQPADGASPSWFDDRLALLTRKHGDAPGVTLVDPRNGSVSDGPGPGRTPANGGGSDRVAVLSIAADGSVVAFASGTDGSIEVAAADPWLAGGPVDIATVTLAAEADGGRSFAWLALSPTGDRLAVVRTNADGDAVAVTIHRAQSGWGQDAQIALPAEADRAVVAWLP